jgi:uncharacterized protein YjiS (DUF1127 family)
MPQIQPRSRLTDALTGLGRRITEARNRRRTVAAIRHLSSARLADIGFERDWDGSVNFVSDGR